MMGKSLKLLVLIILCVVSSTVSATNKTHNTKKSIHKPVRMPTSKAKPMSTNIHKPVQMPTSKAKPMSINKRKPVRMPTSKAKPMSMNKHKPTNKKPSSVTIPPPPGPTPELRDTPTPTPADAMARSMSLINIILASTPKILPNACPSQFGNCWGQERVCCQGSFCDSDAENEVHFCVALPPKPVPKPTPIICSNNGGSCPSVYLGKRVDCCKGLYCDYAHSICVSAEPTDPLPCNDGGADECCPTGDCCDGELCCFGDCCDDDECDWCEAIADDSCSL